jgi:hypothetical protein
VRRKLKRQKSTVEKKSEILLEVYENAHHDDPNSPSKIDGNAAKEYSESRKFEKDELEDSDGTI